MPNNQHYRILVSVLIASFIYPLTALSSPLQVASSTESTNERSTNTLELSTLELPASECMFAGSFGQDKMLTGVTTPLQSLGVFYYHCEHGVIWSTTKPINETLILKPSGTSFVINDGQAKKLTSRQGKFLAKLLNNLMGAEVDAITQQFAIKRLDPSAMHYQLIPKKRSLKRAISELEITLPKIANMSTAPVVIKITDRNAQRTEIRSQRANVFTDKELALEHCYSVEGLTQQSCALLLGLK